MTANPIAAGSSDGGAMLFFSRDGDNGSTYGHVKVVTTIAHGLAGTPQGGRERGYSYSLASNQALPPELTPTLVMYYDPFGQHEEQLLLGGDLRICRLVNGAWTPLPTYLPPGYRFAVAPLDRASGGTLIEPAAQGPRVEYYKVCWVPRESYQRNDYPLQPSVPVTDNLHRIINDLHTIGEHIQTLNKKVDSEKVDSQENRLGEQIERLAGLFGTSTLDKYQGFLSLTFSDEDGKAVELTKNRQPVLQPGRDYKILAWFERDDGRNLVRAISKEISLKEGTESRIVTFNLKLDSDNIVIRPNEHSVTFDPLQSSQDMIYQFIAPNENRTYSIWLEISQKNRLLETMPVKIVVRGQVQDENTTSDEKTSHIS